MDYSQNFALCVKKILEEGKNIIHIALQKQSA